MRCSEAADLFIEDMRALGRVSSDKTERAYRDVLMAHAEDVDNRDPRNSTSREDVKKTLRRWKNPNTQATRHSVLNSFYDWLMHEGERKDNPARQVRRARKRPAQVYRMTAHEVRAFLDAAAGTWERRLAYLGVCAGLRVQELRGLQGQHLAREGWVWVSSDIAKGGTERWVPVIPELEGVVLEARRTLDEDHYVLPSEQTFLTGRTRTRRSYPDRPTSPQTIHRVVVSIGGRAGIAANIHPHLMRHAFADHIARFTGTRVAQQLLGHANLATTQTYLGRQTLDELAAAVRDLRLYNEGGTPEADPATPEVGAAGIEPAFE